MAAGYVRTLNAMGGRCLVMLGCVLAGFVGGCEDVQLKGGRNPVEEFQQATTWPFVPMQMRVHPFTAVEVDRGDEGVRLEARIEMLDRLGDVTKAVGDYRFELYQMERDFYENPAEGKLLYQWSAPMTTLEQNRRHWDSITRTYLFKLQMDQLPRVDGRLVLVTNFTDPGGRHLRAQAVVATNEDE